MKRSVTLMLLMGFMTAHACPAYADAGGDMMSMLESLKRQMSQMQATIDQQNSKISMLESRIASDKYVAPAAVPAPAQQAQMTEADWQKGIKENIGDAVPFLKGAKYGGDLRLRMENFNYYDKNNDAGSTGTAADRQRNRFRIRLRWGFEKDYGDDWKAGFRLATGTTTDQTSTNVSLGNPGAYFNFKTINVERAYALYSPSALKNIGPIQSVTLGGGKVENPFLRYSTPIVWDADVTPEGLYEKMNLGLVNTDDNKLNAVLTAGQFILNENQGLESDAQLFAYQGALNFTTYAFNTDLPIDLSTAVSFYDYPNWFQTVLAANNASGTSYLRNNTSAMDDPRVIDVYSEIVLHVNGMPVTGWADWVRNVGEIDATRAALSDAHGEDTAWGLGVKLGKAKKKGDWEGFYGYYSIPANAVVSAFSDSDFGGPDQAGYSNRKGHKLGLSYYLTDAVQVNWTGYVVEPFNVVSTAIAASSRSESVFRSQLDLVYKF